MTHKGVGTGVANQDKFDLCIIGAGPAGLCAAEKAVAMGSRVALVEAEHLGGVSHNWGTLPAQALAATAEHAHHIRAARTFGLAPGEPRPNFARINARIREVLDAAAPDISPERLTARGIELVRGYARFAGPATLEAGGRTLKARRFLIATGSRPRVPDIPGIDDIDYLTPETVFSLSRKPSHLVVVGGGPTGLALAQSHLRLGVKVTLVEMLEPLSDFDPELVEVVIRRLRAEGLDLRTNTGVIGVAGDNEALGVEIKSGAIEEMLEASHLLFATGRRAGFHDLGLDLAKVKMEGGRPVLGRHGRTSSRRIFIAGEAAGYQGVHAARHSAEQAVRAMLGGSGGPGAIVPRVVHTRPALVELGMNETRAAARFGDRFTTTRTGFSQTDAARADGEPHGHIKVLTRPDGKIIGAGLIGPAAPELAPLFALAIGKGMTPHDLGGLVAPHPAFAQAVSLLASEFARAHPRRGASAWSERLKRLLP